MNETLRGWNQCVDCGRMARPDDLGFHQDQWLDLGGNYCERDYLTHKDDKDCPARRTKKAP